MGEKGNAQSDLGVKVEEPPRTQERPGPQKAADSPDPWDDPNNKDFAGKGPETWDDNDPVSMKALVDATVEHGDLTREQGDRFMSRYYAARAKRGH